MRQIIHLIIIITVLSDHAIAAIATVVALGAIVCAALAFRQYRLTKQKNRVLAAQIAEIIKYYESLIPAPSSNGEESDYIAHGNTLSQLPTENVTTPLPTAGGAAGEADGIATLFHHIEQVILEEQLYLNPLFDSQTAADRFGITSRRIGAAFSQGSEYKSLPRFVRECRLQHACRLLVSKPHMSIKAVGEASGFTNYTTFVTDFKAKYLMTPTDYRKSRAGEDDRAPSSGIYRKLRKDSRS